VTSPPEFWCKIPELDGGHLMPNGLGLNKTERLTLTPSDHSCHMYNINYTDMLVRHDLNVAALAHYLKKAQPNVTRCRDGWTFDVEHNDTNIVTEWDLVCDASTLMTLATALMAVAAICGTLVAGYVSDRWGRKKPFFFFFFIMVVFGVSFAFAPSFEGFLILAIIHSFGSGPVYYILYTMGKNFFSKNFVEFSISLPGIVVID
jgi:Major Facilitator Superfamily